MSSMYEVELNICSMNTKSKPVSEMSGEKKCPLRINVLVFSREQREGSNG